MLLESIRSQAEFRRVLVLDTSKGRRERNRAAGFGFRIRGRANTLVAIAYESSQWA